MRLRAELLAMNDPFLIRYFAAKRVWPWRHEKTPSSQRPGSTVDLTWGEWFRQKFGIGLVAYVALARRENHAQLVADHRAANAQREAA